MKKLVVYFSQTGNTKRVAEFIAKAEKADVEEILETHKRYTGFGWQMSAGFEALMKKKSKIIHPLQDPNDYDVIYIGTPVWAGNIASPIRTYLSEFPITGKKVALFCTMSGDKAEKAFKNMVQLLEECKLLGELPITEKELKAGKADKKVAVWVSRLKRTAR